VMCNVRATFGPEGEKPVQRPIVVVFEAN